MPYCELCGKETDELTKTRVSDADLQVCQDCTDLGTKLETDNSDDEKDTKYSTKNNSSSNSTTTRNSNSNSGNSTTENSGDPFEDVSDLSLDYGQKIQTARQQDGMDREQLAKKLGIKQSHLQNVENEQTQPSLELQNKLEKELNVDLSRSDNLGQ